MKARARPPSHVVQDKDEHNLGKKRRIVDEHNLGDRISELPDEVLVSILSLLPLKEAASTSILSRRWRCVWTSTMTLNFNDINLEAASSNPVHLLRLERKLGVRKRCRYVNWVNHVLQQHRGHNIERFRACFFLDVRVTNAIDKWIRFAMLKRVQILELNFFTQDGVNDYAFPFPHRLLGTSIKKGSTVDHSACEGSTVEQFMRSAWENLLCSDIPSLLLCAYSIGLKSLKVLHLRRVRMSDEVLEYLLSNCPVLERLSLVASRNVVNVRVAGPSIALKHLVIDHCYDLIRIEICYANIVSFVYTGSPMINLLLSNVPLLVEVSISREPFLAYTTRLLSTQLSCCLSHLEVLKLDIRGATCKQNDVFPILPKLKHLELVVDFRARYYINSFLQASPYLRRLVLKLDMIRFRPIMEAGELEEAAQCPHRYLKVVEISGYRACTSVMHLVENAVALEKIVIDPVRSWFWPSEMERPSDEVEEEIPARHHAMQNLKEKVPSTVEFVCL